MSPSTKVLVLAVVAPGTTYGTPDFVNFLREKSIQVELRTVPETKSYLQIIQAFRTTKDISAFDLVVTTEYFASFGLCLRSVISGRKVLLGALSFNVSRRYLRTPFISFNWLINILFQRLSLVVVHSQAERDLFCRIHQLDPDRVALALWGYDLPTVETEASKSPKLIDQTKPYVCMIGRNNRDFAALQEALLGTSIPAIFVASKSSDPALKSSEQIRILYDLPFHACLQILQQSAINLVLLKDAERGAGHITAVSAMLIGKAQIYSKARVLDDYLMAGLHGIPVPIGDVHAIKGAVLRLYHDEPLREKLGSEARVYAETYLSNFAFQRRLFALLHSLLQNEPTQIFDSKWIRYIEDTLHGTHEI